jgi:hypothetical protein
MNCLPEMSKIVQLVKLTFGISYVVSMVKKQVN